MNLKKSPLYNCKSENHLANLINIKDKNLFKKLKYELKHTPNQHYCIFTKTVKGKERELCKCKHSIEGVHKRIKYWILKLDFPCHLFSRLKGKSYISNALQHRDNNFYLLVDIKNFYPSITDKHIKKSLITNFAQSSDVAEFITNAITIWQKNNSVRALVTGSPLSQIFAYFINMKMFDYLDKVSKQNNIEFSVYVDDLSFSSQSTIPYDFVKKVFGIIKGNGFDIAPSKVQYGRKSSKPEITGVQIRDDGIFITDKRLKTINDLIIGIKNKIANKEDFAKEQTRLEACVAQAKLVNPLYEEFYLKNKFQIFPNIF